jgi:hypothetical protein
LSRTLVRGYPQRGPNAGTLLGRRFFMWHAARAARLGESTASGNLVRGPGRTGLVDGARHAHRLTPRIGLGLLVVRGWVRLVGVPSRSEAEAGG